MKNQRFFLLSLLLMLGWSACQNDSKVSNSSSTHVPIPSSASIAEIEALVAAIDAQKDSLIAAGPTYIFDNQGNDKVKTELMVYSNDEAPQLIYCKAPQVESWYYLKDRRPVFLKEMVLAEDGFVQNRFYYGPKKIIGADSRKGASPDETNRGEATEYQSQKDDFRVSAEAATGKVLSFLYGKVE